MGQGLVVAHSLVVYLQQSPVCCVVSSLRHVWRKQASSSSASSAAMQQVAAVAAAAAAHSDCVPHSPSRDEAGAPWPAAGPGGRAACRAALPQQPALVSEHPRSSLWGHWLSRSAHLSTLAPGIQDGDLWGGFQGLQETSKGQQSNLSPVLCKHLKET